MRLHGVSLGLYRVYMWTMEEMEKKWETTVYGLRFRVSLIGVPAPYNKDYMTVTMIFWCLYWSPPMYGKHNLFVQHERWACGILGCCPIWLRKGSQPAVLRFSKVCRHGIAYPAHGYQ